ncbi:MAG: class I SAM-dependent methyltransferase [Nitrososphaeraceae archaeon]
MANKLRTLLGDVPTADERRSVYSSFDAIGDIVIMKIPDSLLYKKYAIGNRLLENLNSANSVFLQTSAIEGDYRLRKLELLAGTNRTVTEHHEHGCRFKVDVSKVYFSPRLSTERLRIAEKVRDNEIVTNMFAGVGTFSILIAKQNPRSVVFNIDSNARASLLCLVNAKLNRVQDRVFPFCGDAKYIASKILSGVSNRVLMPLPERAKEFVGSAIACLKQQGGTIHYFAHVGSQNKKDAINEGILNTTNAFKDYNHLIAGTRVVREVGPRLYQIVSDVSVCRR